MKKIVTVFFCLMLMMSVMLTVQASEVLTLTMKADKVQTSENGQIHLVISAESLPNCKSAGVLVEYDHAVFQMSESKCLVDSAILKDFSEDMGVFAVEKPENLSGNLFSFTLTVKEGTAAGTYPIKVTPRVRDTQGQVPAAINEIQIGIDGCMHTYGNWTSKDDMSHCRVCSNCGFQETQPHQWDQGKITREPTEQSEGAKTYTCLVCKSEKTEVIPRKIAETSEPAQDPTSSETTVPATTVPETTVPVTTVPAATVPKTTVPAAVVPETTVPDITATETSIPMSESTEPETSEPIQEEQPTIETAPAGSEVPVTEGPESDADNQESKSYLWILWVVLAAGGAAVCGFFIYKKKK